MPFAISSNPSQSEISESINYLLSNFGGGTTVDPVTGQITAPGGIIVGYLYQYMAVKYADSSDGSVNFSNSPINRTYFGLRNSNDAAESSNYADYIWYAVSGGFGLTKLLWYQTTGGRQIQFAVSIDPPDSGWVSDTGASIDLDIVTSGNIPVITESFVTYFTPTILQVPRSGDPLTPSFTGIVPQMYATDKGSVIAFNDAQTDTAVGFVNNSWRIGNSATTGNGDISYTNITIGDPVDAGDFAEWPNPTAMSNSPAYIAVPVRYKNDLGVVTQASVATLQLVFVDPGAQGDQGQPGSSVDINGYASFTQNAGGAYTPPNATLSALIQNITSPTYSWAISGATPTSSTSSSVVVTPTSSSTGIDVTLTVNGTNLASPISKTIQMPIVYDGAPGEAGANGIMSAFPTIYIWTGSSATPIRPSTTSVYTWSNGTYTAPSGWSTTAPSNTTAGNYLWAITFPLTVSATTVTSTLDWTNVANPIRCIAYNGANGSTGLNGSRTAVLDMYQWSAIAPILFPAGTSTYTWSTDTFTAPSTTNDWSLTPPTPVSGQTLYVVRQAYADSLTSTTNTIAWAASSSSSFAGVSTVGTRTAFLELYQWAASAPTSFPSGTSTYTWATGSFTPPTTPNGWSRNPGIAVAGLTLWGCQASLTTTGSTTTSSVTWSTSTAYAVSYGVTGGNGAATFVVTRTANDSSAPTNAEVTAVIGRNPVAGDIVTVSYNAANNAVVYRYTTAWVTQATYLTGSLIVSGTITGDKVSANTITGTNIAANTITGTNILATSVSVDRLNSGNMTGGTSSNAYIQMGQSGTVIGTYKSSLNVRKIATDSTLINIAAQNNIDGNVTIWGHSANQAVGSGNGVSGSHTAQNTFTTWQRLGALGSGLTDSAVWGVSYAPVTTSKAGVFERYSGTDSGTPGSLNKSIQLATNGYCAYSPSGQGKIYIVDGNGPFTGFHEGMIALADPVEIGDIVVDLSVFYRYNISNVLFEVERSTTANQGGALGVVANRLLVQETVPGVLWIPESTYTEGDLGPVVTMVLRPEFNLAELQSTYKVVQVNAVGEGQINVCGENGNISPGDLIVCSSIAGKGMKQSDDIVRSITVAKAREAATFSSPTDIQQIACIYISG